MARLSTGITRQATPCASSDVRALRITLHRATRPPLDFKLQDPGHLHLRSHAKSDSTNNTKNKRNSNSNNISNNSHSSENKTWTPKVCRIIAFLAAFGDLGLLFYILLGFR